MHIQLLSQPGVRGVREQDQASDSVGVVGNLQFNIGPDATSGGGRSSGFSRLRDLMANLGFFVGHASFQARLQHGVVSLAPDNGRLIGNLLVSLAAAATDSRAQAKLVRELTQLSELSQGDLGNLPKGRHSLFAHIEGLKRASLFALRDGALGRPEARAAVLSQISPDLCDEALGVLAQMTQALNERMAQEFVPAPLSRIIELVSASPLDGKALDQQLNALYAGIDLLDTYFQSLPGDQLVGVLSALSFEGLDAAHEALTRTWKVEKDAGQQIEAFTILDRLRASVGRQIHAQAQSELTRLYKILAVAIRVQHHVDAIYVLQKLNDLVHKNQLAYGCLPEEMAEAVRKLIKDSLSLFRNHWCDLDDPLRVLDQQQQGASALDCLRYFPPHASSLRPFGLDLDLEQANARTMQEVARLSLKLVEALIGVLRTLSEERVEVPVFMRQLRDLAVMQLQRTRQLTVLGQVPSDGLSMVDQGEMIRQTCERAMDGLLCGGQAFQMQNALSHLPLIRGLESELVMIVSKMNNVLVQKDYKEGDGQISRQLVVAHQLLNGMAGAMNKQLTDILRTVLPDTSRVQDQHLLEQAETGSAADAPPNTFYLALREIYGVAYDPSEGEVAVLVMDSVYEEGA